MIIYLCAFKSKTYIEEAKVCIRSIREKGMFTGDIFLFTDLDVSIDGVKIIKASVTSIPMSSAYRLRFFNHLKLEDLPKNEIILYLDTDIVVLNKIPSFEDIDDKINVYGYDTRTQIGASFSGFITTDTFYTAKQAICAGILLYRPNELVKKTFDDAYDLFLDCLEKGKMNACWEQPSLCYMLTKHNMSTISLSKVVYEERNRGQKISDDHIFNHFCGLRGADRYKSMTKYLE